MQAQHWYIRKVIVHLVQKYFWHDCSTDSLTCSGQKKGIGWKLYQNETATRYRRDSVSVSNAIASKIDTPLSFPIDRSRRLSSASASVVVVEVFVLIFLRQRLRRHCRFLGPVVDPAPPQSLSLIPRTCCLFIVLHRRLRCCRWVLQPVFPCRSHNCRCQLHGTVNTLPPPPL